MTSIDADSLTILTDQPIGSGGFADVYKGELQTETGKLLVAVKIFRGVENVDDEEKLNLQLRQLRHENIVKTLGVTKLERPLRLALVMELAERSLAKAMQFGLTDSEKFTVAKDASSGLAYLHRLHMAHRDLKPENILLFKSEPGGLCAKLADFDLSHQLRSVETVTDRCRGTLCYMAPELLAGQGNRKPVAYTLSVDIYSLGITFYEIFVEQSVLHGFGVDDDLSVLFQVGIANRRPLFPPQFSRRHQALQMLIERCWQREPGMRPSADEVYTSVCHCEENWQNDDGGVPNTNAAYFSKFIDDRTHDAYRFDSAKLPFISDSMKIPISWIVMGRAVGEGAFGVVILADLYEDGDPKQKQTVAVKIIKPTVANIGALCDEGLRMKMFDHENVLHLCGIVVSGQTVWLVTPFMENGDLRTYLLRKNHDMHQSVALRFALEIATGMEYLHAQKMVHRDLAARNCMLTAQLQIKIADFGLCREMTDSGHYETVGSYAMPVCWLAPESITTNVFGKKTDVWSFGVVLWEITSRGADPSYENSAGMDEFVSLVLSGVKLPQPPACSGAVYGTMLSCWEMQPEKRPTFSRLREVFTTSQLVHKLRTQLITQYTTTEPFTVMKLFKSDIEETSNIEQTSLEIRLRRRTSSEPSSIATDEEESTIIDDALILKKIARRDGNIFNFMILLGDAGSGKTTFTKRLAFDWARAQSRQDSNSSVFRDFELLFVCQLRNWKKEHDRILDYLLCGLNLAPADAGLVKQWIIENPAKVLVILDGVDELASVTLCEELTNIVVRGAPFCLPPFPLILTSRPYGMLEQARCKLFFEIAPPSKQIALDIADTYCRSAAVSAEVCAKIRNFVSRDENNFILLSWMLLRMFCLVGVSSSAPLPTSQTEAYFAALQFMMDYNSQKSGKPPPVPIHATSDFRAWARVPFMQKLAEYAFEKCIGDKANSSTLRSHVLGLQRRMSRDSSSAEATEGTGQWIFDIVEVRQKLGVATCAEALEVGFLTGDLTFMPTALAHTNNMKVSFVHKSFQEFFAAIYFVSNPSAKAVHRFVDACKNDTITYFWQNEQLVKFAIGVAKLFAVDDYDGMTKRMLALLPAPDRSLKYTNVSKYTSLILSLLPPEGSAEKAKLELRRFIDSKKQQFAYLFRALPIPLSDCWDIIANLVRIFSSLNVEFPSHIYALPFDDQSHYRFIFVEKDVGDDAEHEVMTAIFQCDAQYTIGFKQKHISSRICRFRVISEVSAFVSLLTTEDIPRCDGLSRVHLQKNPLCDNTKSNLRAGAELKVTRKVLGVFPSMMILCAERLHPWEADALACALSELQPKSVQLICSAEQWDADAGWLQSRQLLAKQGESNWNVEVLGVHIDCGPEHRPINFYVIEQMMARIASVDELQLSIPQRILEECSLKREVFEDFFGIFSSTHVRRLGFGNACYYPNFGLHFSSTHTIFKLVKCLRVREVELRLCDGFGSKAQSRAFCADLGDCAAEDGLFSVVIIFGPRFKFSSEEMEEFVDGLEATRELVKHLRVRLVVSAANACCTEATMTKRFVFASDTFVCKSFSP